MHQAAESTIVLPPPADRGVTLARALEARRSVRDFSARPLAQVEMSQLLWAAQGITHPDGHRTAPSAGALYPLELYVATSEGVFHYLPPGHRLARLENTDVRAGMQRAALGQPAVGSAPAVFVVAAVYPRTAAKYGAERGARFVHIEVAHVAQNLLLEAVALGLGAVPVGAFDDLALARVLGLPPDQAPLYLIPVGEPLR
jgi:SagB-type dehydrogenase family enzyme